jgi:hypothetical protein
MQYTTNQLAIQQAIKQTEAKGLKVVAVNVHPRDAFGLNWKAFGANVEVRKKDNVPRGRFSLSTQKAT